MRVVLLAALFALTILPGCGTDNPEPSLQPTAAPDSVSVVREARGFSLEWSDGHRRLTVWDPERRGEPLARYQLVPRGEVLLANPVRATYRLAVPVQRLVVLSTSHLGIIDRIGHSDAVVGIAQSQFVYDAAVRARIADGAIVDVGQESALNIEQLVALQPDAVMFSNWQDPSGVAERLRAAGIVPIYNLEWMETTPLGRTEWMVAVGALLGVEAAARATFDSIAAAYNATAEAVRTPGRRPTVLTGSNYQGTWYVPGGNSFMGQFLRDAGADYHWAEDNSRGSIALSFEAILDTHIDADIWINPGAAPSLEWLADADPRYARFKAFREGAVYNNNARLAPGGGNDYWESGVAAPHRILADLAAILHPERFPDHTLHYFQRLR